MMPITPLWDLYLNHKTCKSSLHVRVLDLKPVSAKYGRGTGLKPSVVICELFFDLLLIYYISNFILHALLKFVYLHVIYNLAISI
jgi:hypothetical protein